MSAPPPPPGFTLDPALPRKPKVKDVPPPPPEGFNVDPPAPPTLPPAMALAAARAFNDRLTGQAVDGDTLRLQSGNSLRLYGADAPELKQPGLARDGSAVPLGQNALAKLRSLVVPGAPIGPAQGVSYGRPVAPVTVNGADVGKGMIRSGNAVAAPSFMAKDPARKFDYQQAERLARLNGLGLHDTFAQLPAEYRKAPATLPQLAQRETVARFWDSPTPWAGMPGDVEKQVLALIYNPSVPLEQAAALAKDKGGALLDMDAAKASRDYFIKTGKAPGMTYRNAPKVLTDNGDGRTGAVARGFGNGVLPNLLEETGAAVDSLGGTDNRENVFNSDRRWADIWWNNQQQNEAITGYDKATYPYAEGTAELAGGLVVPIGKVRSAADLAKFGAGYGAASGFGRDGTLPERMTSGVVGLGEGLVTTVVGGKALEKAAPYIGKGYRWVMGKNGPERVPEGIAGDMADIGPLSARGAPDGAPVGADVPPPPEGFTVDEPRMLGDLPGADRNRILQEAEKAQQPLIYDEAKGDWRDLTPEEAAARHAEIDKRYAADPVVKGSDVPPPPAGFTLDQHPSQPMAVEPMPSLSQDVPRPDGIPTRSMNAPVTEAQIRAADIQPGDVTPIPSNEVGSLSEAQRIEQGRYAPASAPNENLLLTPRTIRAWNGAEVPKRGPVDIVGWLRTQGGLKDQRGELSHMGLTNAGRKMDFAGQEQRFGPLVNDQGMNLDDAALRAWEAGYFPDHTDRPSVNEFLNALRSTHEGRARNFLPEDLAELDAFHAARQERYALQEQRFETGSEVVRDRSVSAGDDQPFPPPEAYHEWPQGGPSRAGNIDLNRLDSPQDIKRALTAVHERVGGFDDATRGRITHAETEALASELGMTPDSLLARRKGQAFSAEEALASRQILAKSSNELVNAAKRIKSLDNPGDELLADFQRKLMRHVAIQEQVAGMTAEAGRTLQSFRMIADSKNVRGEVLAAMVGGGGGANRIKTAAETLLDAVESGPGVFNALADKATKPKWRDKISELYINFLLSFPQTHAVNITSNTLTSIAQIPEHATAALIGGARSAFSNSAIDRITSSEVGARAFGLLQGAKEGARMFASAIRTGEASDLIAKVEGEQYKAIKGIKGEVVRVPTRLLTAEDEFFKGIARRMELNGEAVRIAHKEGLKGAERQARIAELVSDPTDEMLSKAMEYGRYLTFQRKLGPAAQDISNFANRHLLAKAFLPFVRTPTNLVKFAAERSPAAPLLKEWRADFLAGGPRRDLAISRALLGTGFGFAMYEAALAGNITGSAPTDPRKSRLLYADGWKPYSVKIGDTYYSYKRLDPFSTTIGVAADLATLPDGMSERQREDKTTLLVASIMGNLASKTWLSGVSDVVSALHEPDRYADNLVQRLVGAFLIPNLVAGTARTLDPVARETETLGDALRARVPGMREGLFPQRDVWGRRIVNEGGIGPDFLSPVWASKEMNDPVNHELMQLDYAPGELPRKVGGVELTAEQYDRYQELAGGRAHDALGSLVTSPAWRALDDEGKVKAAQKTVAKARESVRSQMFGGAAEAPESGGKATPPPPPAGFQVDGAAGGVNFYSDLQKAIPGVRFTSGFRTPEYQAEMRARGYRPAENSGHLDGSALDMLPPPGKSLGWLRNEVGRDFPQARLLVHDGHLHATFPGYYGAPPLGGARGRLKNPNAGMPPPPAGFKLD